MKGPKAEKIQQLFDSIAKDYDKLNHIPVSYTHLTLPTKA